jgi:hypothetical protein
MQATLDPAAQTAGVFEFDHGAFQKNFNQQCFGLEHTLAGHPLFTVERLVQLARQTAKDRPSDLYFDKGATTPGQRWNETPACELPIDETIRRLEHEGAWIILKHAEIDSDYKEILERAMGEVFELTGREIERQIKYSEVILFIASPRRLTTYHIDRECNFVAQIRGEKTIYIFDRDDRDVLPEAEIERFWAVDTNSARYKPEFQSRAHTFLLRPGTGVHIPVHAPHWLQNHDDISITASLNFKFKESVQANIYRMNYFIRKFGVVPTPPGQSRALDLLKRSAVTALMTANQKIPSAVRDRFKRAIR